MGLTKRQAADLASTSKKLREMAAKMNRVAAGRVPSGVKTSPVDAVRYEITSIKYLAGELTLRVVGDGEVPQQLESGQMVILREVQP